MKRLFILASIVYLTLTYLSAQTTMTISGGHVVVSGSPIITLSDTDWENRGTFTADQSTVRFIGADTSRIKGTNITNFRNLEINKPSRAVILEQTIDVGDTVRFVDGLLNLNNNNLNLSSDRGGLAQETETSRVYGPNGGEIIKIVPLNNVTNANPGNLGFSITTTSNLDSTTIRRGHQPQTLAAGNSVNRYYQVSSKQAPSDPVNVQFDYFDAELGSFASNETDLELFDSQDNGGNWNQTGFASKDATLNFITQSKLNTFGRFTLSTITSFPVEWLGFDAWPEDRNIRCQWLTASEVNSDYFSIERSQDGVAFTGFSTVQAAGNSQEVLSYETLDFEPYLGESYYRVKQVDLDGTFSYAPMVAVYLAPTATLSLFPNPSFDKAYLDMSLQEGGQIQWSMIDMNGRTVQQDELELTSGDHRLPLDVSWLPEGHYVLRVNLGSEIAHIKMVVK